MGRRKKEPRSVHREHISAAAQSLFMSRGIEAVTMNDIAKEAGYSKATLYVYFQNKEEIVGLLVLESMKKLYDYITSALEAYKNTRERYDAICLSILRYSEEFPFYFKIALDEINIDFTTSAYLPEEKETYLIGEEINEKLRRFLNEGVKAGELRANMEIVPTIVAFWGMLSGLIRTSVNKEAYVRQESGLSKEEFLSYGFGLLYRSVAAP